MPTQPDGDTVNVCMAKCTSGMPPIAGLDIQKPVTSMDGMNGAFQEGFVSGDRTWGMMNQMSGSGIDEYEGKESGVVGGIYDGMALPDHFLGQYYTQVRNQLNISIFYSMS